MNLSCVRSVALPGGPSQACQPAVTLYVYLAERDTGHSIQPLP